MPTGRVMRKCRYAVAFCFLRETRTPHALNSNGLRNYNGREQQSSGRRRRSAGGRTGRDARTRKNATVGWWGGAERWTRYVCKRGKRGYGPRGRAAVVVGNGGGAAAAAVLR